MKIMMQNNITLYFLIPLILALPSCKKNAPNQKKHTDRAIEEKKIPLDTREKTHTLNTRSKNETKKTTARSESLQSKPPKFIIPIVIDQCAYHYFTRFDAYFEHGFRRFLDHGLVFTNAHHPHAAPVTATGHATLSTGVYPAQHGIIMNTWYSANGNLVESIDDNRNEARVHNVNGSCTCKASSHHIVAPSISDVVTQASTKDCTYHTYAISFKDRAAIGMAGHQGKAIWFDTHQQAFTSNYDYFPNSLPEWLLSFNTFLPQKISAARHWKLFHVINHEVYSNFAKEIYHLSCSPITIAGTELPGKGDWKKLDAIKNFMLAPESSTMLFDLAFHAMDEINQQGNNDRGLIWLSLSSLDKVGHMYGPNSLETIDTMMHLDKIIGDFMTKAEQLYGKGSILFMLTADHGVSPIPENMIEENYRPAKRIVMHPVVKDLNAKIKTSFALDELFFGFKTNQLFWNENKLTHLSSQERTQLITFVKKELKQYTGIKKIWTIDELMVLNPPEDSVEFLFKNQVYKGRSGYFFLLGRPYVMLTNFDKGSCHRTPYNYDTQIPLMLLCPEKLAANKICNKVITLQVAPTIAATWGIEPDAHMKNKPLPTVLGAK